jgi:hypothetical protein
MSLIKHTSNYTTVANHVTHSKLLTWKAKGLYLYLNSKQDGWDFSIERISKESSDTFYSTEQGIKELKKFGLLIQKPKTKKLPNGKVVFCGQEYHLYEKIVLTEQKIEIIVDTETPNYRPPQSQPLGEYPTQNKQENNKPTLSPQKESESQKIQDQIIQYELDIFNNPMYPIQIDKIKNQLKPPVELENIDQEALNECAMAMICDKKSTIGNPFNYLRTAYQIVISNYQANLRTRNAEKQLDITNKKAEYYNSKKTTPNSSNSSSNTPKNPPAQLNLQPNYTSKTGIVSEEW